MAMAKIGRPTKNFKRRSPVCVPLFLLFPQCGIHWFPLISAHQGPEDQIEFSWSGLEWGRRTSVAREAVPKRVVQGAVNNKALDPRW